MKNTTEQRIQKERFQSDCLTFCEINGIHPLSKDVLDRCLKMPDDGITATNKFVNLTNTFYPIITSNFFDSNIEEKLGHYDTNNGIIVFVYIDSSTYVTRDWSVFSALGQAGYKRGNLPVPLSSDEEIDDSNLRRKWESLPKNCFSLLKRFN